MKYRYDIDLCDPVTVIYRGIVDIHSQMEEEPENDVFEEEEEEDVVDIDDEFEEVEEEINDDNNTVSEK
jgi:hypothetical protein